MSKVSTSGTTVSSIVVLVLITLSTLSTGLEKDTTLLAAIGWRRGETAGHGSKAPFLNICFDEDET
jgi:hypothetical protein